VHYLPPDYLDNSMEPRTSRTPRRWTSDEDDILRTEAAYQRMFPIPVPWCWALTNNTVVNAGSIRDWNRIASRLPGRLNKDCRKRWSKISENVKKGNWQVLADDEAQHRLMCAQGPERRLQAETGSSQRWHTVPQPLQGKNSDADIVH
jgi:hypothetical protein